MQISRTKIKSRSNRKTNPSVKETISLALKTKNKTWHNIAKILSGSTNAQVAVNLSSLEEKAKAGDTVLILGKVLSQGALSKKLRIVALSFSEAALEKLKESKSEAVTIAEEINKNPKAEGLKIYE